MFKSTIETDKYGDNQKHYYLTQGDSFTIYATPKKDGQAISLDLISVCKFKLSDSAYVKEFEKELTKNETAKRFELNVTSEESTNFDVASHIYEIEYTFKDGIVQTPNQWKFDVLDQIVE